MDHPSIDIYIRLSLPIDMIPHHRNGRGWCAWGGDAPGIVGGPTPEDMPERRIT